MRVSVACLVLLMSLATACLPPQRREVVARSGVSDADLQGYAGTGPCAIHGQAFLKTRGGDVKYGAGEMVTLMPDTALLNEILRINSTPGVYAALPPDVLPKWESLKRRSQADGEGRFQFEAIPCGAWFVETRVTWEVIEAGVQGGPVSAHVQVQPASSPARVILTY